MNCSLFVEHFRNFPIRRCQNVLWGTVCFTWGQMKYFELTLSKVSFYISLNLFLKRVCFSLTQAFFPLDFDLATEKQEGAVILQTLHVCTHGLALPQTTLGLWSAGEKAGKQLKRKPLPCKLNSVFHGLEKEKENPSLKVQRLYFWRPNEFWAMWSKCSYCAVQDAVAKAKWHFCFN